MAGLRVMRLGGFEVQLASGGSVQTYLTMVRYMDEGIGRILAALAPSA